MKIYKQAFGKTKPIEAMKTMSKIKAKKKDVPQEPVNIEAPRVWFKLWELEEPGLYVYGNEYGYAVGRVIFIIDGLERDIRLYNENKTVEIHGSIATNSTYQKIKE